MLHPYRALYHSGNSKNHSSLQVQTLHMHLRHRILHVPDSDHIYCCRNVPDDSHLYSRQYMLLTVHPDLQASLLRPP